MTHMGDKGNAFSILVGNMKGRDHLKDLNTDAHIIRCGKISYIYIYIYIYIYVYIYRVYTKEWCGFKS